jgi:hypothetical protein
VIRLLPRMAYRDWREGWLNSTVSEGAYNTYTRRIEEGKSGSSRSASKVASLVRELPLIALSTLSLGIWAPILVAITSLAMALALARQ